MELLILDLGCSLNDIVDCCRFGKFLGLKLYFVFGQAELASPYLLRLTRLCVLGLFNLRVLVEGCLARCTEDGVASGELDAGILEARELDLIDVGINFLSVLGGLVAHPWLRGLRHRFLLISTTEGAKELAKEALLLLFWLLLRLG